ncbi:OST-HTH/LOTUS domain-containing protein [Thiorhodovibrio litoralis]|uniref:OST-HTH/LOTUS domain-containing protein n=1 Tax=Thiorhodovibrio litoralis TaxID=2952932 RepID=UPI002B262970|nr:OST-HTH/LOTUS domain-containing protein [Thiorhodovibrio litoralis]
MDLDAIALTVLGFGEKKTPDAFRNACHKFVFTEVLLPSAAIEPAVLAKTAENDRQSTSPQPTLQVEETKNKFPKKFVLAALEQSSDDAGWAHLGTFGSYLTKLQPDFDSRLYGYKKLSELVKAKTDIFVTEERQAQGSKQKVLYLRAK